MSNPPRRGATPSLADCLLAWRDRLVASPRFQRWATAFPPTRPIARRQARRLFDLTAGFVYAQVLLACVQLRLFEMLAEGPREAAQLALDLDLPPDSCRRLLGAAVSLGLLERRAGGRFGLGLLGAAALGNPGVGAMVAHHPLLYADLADPVALLRRGRGTALAGYWPYASAGGRALGAEEVAPYSALMSASQPLVAGEILDAYPFARHRSLLDVGGGDGTFAAAVARRAPSLRVATFDLPAVADLARARFVDEGLAGRATAFGGDMFRDPLPAGHDVATLVRVIHDHDDGPALAILTAVRAALAPGGILVLAEPMAEAPGAAPVGDAYFAFYLLAMGSGRARTVAELSRLCADAGFSMCRPHHTRMPLTIGVLTARA